MQGEGMAMEMGRDAMQAEGVAMQAEGMARQNSSRQRGMDFTTKHAEARHDGHWRRTLRSLMSWYNVVS